MYRVVCCSETLVRVSLCSINHLLLPYVFPEPELINVRKVKMDEKTVHRINYFFTYYRLALHMELLIVNTTTFKFKWKFTVCILSDVHRCHFGDDMSEV